jgi:hypothetical protein
MTAITYREGFKYQLVEDYTIVLPIRPETDLDIIADFYSFGIDGALTVKAGYAWDGASGPAIDTPAFMRGSLVHDVLYQMMGERQLDPEKFRQPADAILRDICREDGMSAIRAWWVYRAVRFGGGGIAKAPDKPPKTAP